MKKKLGFTLIELVIVIGLLGILATAGFTSYIHSMQVSRDAKRKTDLESIRQALEMYKSDNGNYFLADTGYNGDMRGWYNLPLPTYSSMSQVLITAGYLSTEIEDPQFGNLPNNNGHVDYGYMIYACQSDGSPCTLAQEANCDKYVIYAKLEDVKTIPSSLPTPNCYATTTHLQLIAPAPAGNYQKNYWVNNP